ncbi:amidase signature enzyme [Hortaea werneckii]|uniref:Glutamyl-tRNA(Gln) amidotransferase subunit A, mitochondrial n=1 Tax=Hortaea werneckii EXF-2000 TaxID=1157616 RepID=A0A1Z5TR99_HORWE|nr:amidase signature enzyme [Hortaea werneckii]OTA38535.1 hypothetical protein BTJ68_01654 [Hortaea werneckii EXF-2000]KAI6845630.1 amidase signature enzyme [Hortaea werneckii]KAI6923673.1 amidase signature enzyme [Hortaea werneckii]KAI6938581.1 amidase signature enzyme [Hortaea werneckii]
MLLVRFCLRKAGRRACDYARPSSLAISARRYNHHNAIVAEVPHHQSQDAGHASGFLAGKPIAIKDNIVTRDLLTTAASKALSDFTSPFDATVVRLLREHGALISSKTNLDEFGMGSHSQHSHFGPVTSLFSRSGQPLSAGGSSGGSAVAVATGQAWAALGTDTGGSVRLPAAYAGTVGFKPSYGMLSRWGVIQYANSLDTIGVLARTVEDARRVFRSLNTWCKEDPTSLPTSLREKLNGSGSGQRKALRIGVPAEYNIEELSPPVRAAYSRTLSALQSAGHTLHAISLPSTRRALSAYYILAPAEASSNLAKYDGVRYGHRTSSGPDAAPTTQNLPLYAQTRGEAFGAEVQCRILLGAYTLSSEALSNYFIQAQRVRRLVQRDFDRVFARPNPLHDDHNGGGSTAPGSRREPDEADVVDIILTPTAPTLPPTLEEVRRQSPVESYMNDVFTVPASLAGLPAVSVPVSLSAEERRGLGEGDVGSVGLQCIGQFGDDEGVLSAAEIVEGLGR